MVEDTRKTAGTDTFKPINIPEPVRVEEINGLPVAVKEKRRQAVVAIIDRWRIDDEWWRSEPISRMYFSVVAGSGQRMMIYKDLVGSGWYKQVY